MAEPRKVVLLGATGSIGQSTQAVVRAHQEKLRFVGLAAGTNRAGLDAVADAFQVKETRLFADDGLEGLRELATLPEADIVLIATTGTIGLQPALDALAAGKDIAVASKDIIVVAGPFLNAAARAHGGRILPLDSEHNALFQCLEAAQHPRDVRRLILTASGGPFRDFTRAQMANVTVEDALKHPTWSMGPKVTVDSATLANKGLEMMEARWLFDFDPARIEAVIHPQSLVHGMVEFADGAVLAHLCPTSMTFPIQHALLYPDREPGAVEPLDFATAMTLDFHPPDIARFPCLQLATDAMRAGGAAPAVFAAADEVAVEAFLAGRLGFLDIARVIEDALAENLPPAPPTVDAALEAFEVARSWATQAVQRYQT